METITDPQQQVLYEVLSAAAAHLDARQPDEALKVLRSRGGLALSNPVGRNILGEIELQRGRAAEALRAFDAALQLAPHFAEAHANRGAALIDLGRLQDALEAERRALRFKPNLATAHFNRGLVLTALRRRDEAIAAFGDVIRERPDHAEALFQRGVALLGAGRPLDALADFARAERAGAGLPELKLAIAEAQRALGEKEQALVAAEQALRTSPQDAKALRLKATALIAMGRLGEALPLVEGLRKLLPRDGEVRTLLFKALRGLGRHADALASADEAINELPDCAEGYVLRALALAQLGRLEESLDAFLAAGRRGARGDVFDEARALLSSAHDRPELLSSELPVAEAVVARAPGNAEGYLYRFRVMNDLARPTLALEDAQAAVRLTPANPRAQTALAMSLTNLDRIDEAMDAVKKAESAGASDADYHQVRAILLARTGDLDAAKAAFERAIELAPADASRHHQYGMFLLSVGAMEAGWREHEWRLKMGVFADMVSSAPLWQGEELTGKRVLVRHEQGIGDNIQFARFVPELAARTASLAVLMPPALVGLLRRSLAPIEVADSFEPRVPFDYQMAAMSLPLALNKMLAEIAAAGDSYLIADPVRVAHWRDRLGSGGLKVGIAWQGNPQNLRDFARSIPLGAFAPMAAVPGVRLISLQAVHGLDQLDALPAGLIVERYDGEIERNPGGFEEIAAMMPNLDLVVAADTAVAHVAGAMKRPTWIALGQRADWRWMHAGTETPWYRTARLFRMGNKDDWNGVFAEIADALAALAAGRLAVPRR